MLMMRAGLFTTCSSSVFKSSARPKKDSLKQADFAESVLHILELHSLYFYLWLLLCQVATSLDLRTQAY